MGALHRGHLQLIAEARRRADHVVASIFVNPLQFGEGEDFGRYPRQERIDYLMLKGAGSTIIWIPHVDHIYPADFSTNVSVRGVADRWEGEARPGHFDGVATVVTRLLMAVRPDMALFGEKDFQQLAVIRQMVRDLAIPTEIVGVPTVRDEQGLALSSRNAYLSADEQQRAMALPRALQQAQAAIRSGAAVNAALEAGKSALSAAGFSRIDYFALVDARTLEPRNQAVGKMRLIAAAVIGTTRLIDNIEV
jgi:pantoate--beta-alanine ligase